MIVSKLDFYVNEILGPGDFVLSEVGSSSIAGGIITPKSIYITDDGTKIFAQESGSSDGVFRFDMSTAFDITTETFTNEKAKLLGANTPLGSFFKPDGSKYFVINSGKILQASLSTNFDTSTQGAVTDYTFTNAITGSILKFSSDGTKCLVRGFSDPNISILECVMSSAWDVTTITSETHRQCPTSTPSFDNFDFANDGFNLITLDLTSQNIELIGLTSAYDLSTMTDITDTFSYARLTGASNLTISRTDDSFIYILDSGASKIIYQLSLTIH